MKKLFSFAALLVVFATACVSQPHAQAVSGCKIGGCSNQLCVEDSGGATLPIASTCEWTEKYGCYQKVGKCEKQDDGKCGWTKTKELDECMAKVDTKQNDQFKEMKVK